MSGFNISQKETGSEDGNLIPGKEYFNELHLDGKVIRFVSVPYSVCMRSLMKMLLDEWHLSLPKIILYTIAETDDSRITDDFEELSHKLVTALVHAWNTTEMWLFTDGLDTGLSHNIGKALEIETSRRKTEKGGIKSTGFPETKLIGICRKDEKTLEEDVKKMNINRHFDYFIFVDDTTESEKGVPRFLLNFAAFINSSDCKEFIPSAVHSLNSKITALLLHGKITQIDLVWGHLKQGLPLIVFEGSGGLADLLAFTHNRARFRPESMSVADFYEAVLKPQVWDILLERYPKFSDYEVAFYTAKLIDCVRYSNLRNPDGIITVIDLHDVDFKPSHLPSILLKSIFKAESSDKIKDIAQLKSDLLLTIDLNSPNIAKKEVFAKDVSDGLDIDKDTFFTALTKPNREEFVSLFLDRGFVVHTYLNAKQLLLLFNDSLNREFFRTVIWEKFFGLVANEEIPRSFLQGQLNNLIKEFTSIPSFIYCMELDWNSTKTYDDRTPEEAERKAMAVLALWAILSFRVQLVKVLWKHSEQPIHIALVCSIILKKLEASVSDFSLQTEMKKNSKEFSIMASDVISLCDENVSCRSLDLLNEKNGVWSFKSLMELAAFAENKMFLAQPCCQKFLDNLFMGPIKIREGGAIPLWLKIISYAAFLFPICLWVRFEMPPTKKQTKGDSSECEQEGESCAEVKDEEEMLSSTQKEETDQPGVLSKISNFWSAPITKFWTSQIMYLLFLALFSAAVLWPACGNIVLDFLTCVWIGILIIDYIYHVTTSKRKYASTPIVSKCLEILVLITFLVCYVIGRILWKQSFMTPYNAKVMLCFALIYFYYRLIFVALPISSELGPMLYRVRRMITVDFSSFIRVAILIMIGNVIAIHATIYPDYPLGVELIRRIAYDALVSFFLASVDPYGVPDPKCNLLTMRSENRRSFVGYPDDVCKVGRYYLPDCPNPGVWPYIFGLQFLIIIRLILFPMLFALFSNTARKLEEEGEYIWKYQRYELVTSFSNRPILPPPFSLFEIIYKLLLSLFKTLVSLSRITKRSDSTPEQEDKLDEVDFRYWKNLALQFHAQKEKEEEEETTTRKRMDRIHALSFALNHQRRILRDLTGHTNELKLKMTNTHRLLSSELKVSLRERLQARGTPQIFSRTSPYPNTMITRLPVSDNHVPWSCEFFYDPVSFTAAEEDFPSYLRPYLDVDIHEMRETEKDDFEMPPFYWNCICLSPGGGFADRQIWIADDDDTSEKAYELDYEGLPKNPHGRTGLKGRGFLPRWGPNHYIHVLITRWHKKDTAFQKYLDVVLMKIEDDDTSYLPGGYVHTENTYDVIRSLFRVEEAWSASEDMVQYFQSLLKNSEEVKETWRRSPKEDEGEEIQKFRAERIKLGYLDEETNTDQAWCEVEVWHFHYGVEENVEENVKGNISWYLMDEEVLSRVPIGQAAIMYSVAKKMKAITEMQ